MRLAIPVLASLIALPAFAQSDAPGKARENGAPGMAVSGNVAQVKMEDDNDPFVPNAFVGSFRMEMHRFRDGAEDQGGTVNMRYWSSTDKTLMAMSQPGRADSDMKLLTDLAGKWTYTLMTDPKGNRTALKSHKKKVVVGEGDGGRPVRLTATGETKTIDGHSCAKYIAQTAEGAWTGWVAQDIAVPFKDIAGSLSMGAVQRNREDWSGMEGFPLEFEILDKDGKGKTVVYIKDLSIGTVDPAVFSMDGYSIVEIPGFGR